MVEVSQNVVLKTLFWLTFFYVAKVNTLLTLSYVFNVYNVSL